MIDNGFRADPATDHHQEAVAGALRQVLAPGDAEATDAHGAITTHGAIVSRIIAGQVVAGDSFPKARPPASACTRRISGPHSPTCNCTAC
ncbi:hypothetical protein WJ972_15390 [Achromobacter insuavis]